MKKLLFGAIAGLMCWVGGFCEGMLVAADRVIPAPTPIEQIILKPNVYMFPSGNYSVRSIGTVHQNGCSYYVCERYRNRPDIQFGYSVDTPGEKLLTDGLL